MTRPVIRPTWLRRRRADGFARTEAMIEGLRRWAGLVEAGMTPPDAWEAVARTLPACDRPRPGCCLHHGTRRRAAQERWGDPAVSSARMGLTAEPGRWRAGAPDEGEELVTAALAAGRRAGAAPAAVARQLAHALEESADAARARQSAAAGPKATARLLSWLPLGGLGMAWLLGTSPADLLSTPFGWILLVLGGMFWAAGGAWTRLAIQRAVRDPGEADPDVVVDLVAALLTAGRSLPAALDDVAVTLPSAARLRVVTTLLLWGRDWDEAWEPVADSPAWREVGERLRPLHRTGMAGARTLAETAAAMRQQGRRADERAAEELAVRLVVPLGLCQLPAFVCWGVVPLAIALLGPAG